MTQRLADGDAATQLARARAEIARLRAELAGAEERGRQLERADVLSHLRRDHSAFIAAGDIERGDHVRTGTTPPDAG